MNQRLKLILSIIILIIMGALSLIIFTLQTTVFILFIAACILYQWIKRGKDE